MRKNRWIYSAIIVAAISFLTIGYSAFTNNLNIDTILAYFRAEADIRITNISLDKFENNAISQYEEYGVDGISSEITLPAANSTITYKIDVTNFGGVKMVLSKINGLPDNLMYTIDNYELDHIICDDDNKCMLGITKPLLLTIKYKDAGYNVEDTTYNLNLNFDFSECKYKIKYHNLFIPKEYQEVEYIESTGTQRLNTKYMPKTNTKMELVLSFSGDFDISSGTVGTGTFFSSSANGNVFSVNFGSAASQGNNLFTWFDKNQANGGAIHYYDTNNSIRTNKNTMTYEKGIFKYGSSNAKTVAVKSENQTTPMYLFGSETKNFDRYNMKVYRLKFSEDGVLKRDYIPCYRKSDGVVGLYELLTGTFHPNIGTGEFNKGNDVTNSQVEADYTTVQTVSYDETSSIKSPELDRKDYNLTGWTTNKDGSGTKYEVGQNFTNLCTTNNCEINLYAQWRTYVGEEIYYVMNSIATPDNIQSQYVSSPNGIDFTQSSGITNGRGLYVMADTINSPHPIYYYRGKVNDNNAVFGKFCWKILRTTDTGGIRLLYNGLKADDGTCNNTGTATEAVSGKAYNPTNIGIASAGYSYTDKSSLKLTVKNDSSVLAGTIFAHDVTYNTETGMYILSDDRYISTSNFTQEKDENLKTHHFTCLKTVDEGCSSVYYVYMTRDAQYFYATLKNGMTITDFLNIEFEGNSTNQIKSTLHTAVETWYAANMTDLTPLIEDSVYCNDRSIYNPWSLTSTVENNNDLKMHFATKARIAYTGKPTMVCKYKADSFSVSSEIGNGKLTYPVGLITLDEAALAGMGWQVDSTDNFLNNGRIFWTMSPGFISATGSYNGVIHSMSDTVAVNYIGSTGGGVRPVITLKNSTKIIGGFGTAEKPFIFE